MTTDQPGQSNFIWELLVIEASILYCVYTMLDWMTAIGGNQLADQVFRVYAKDLETVTLSDLRPRVAENLTTLLAEAVHHPGQ